MILTFYKKSIILVLFGLTNVSIQPGHCQTSVLPSKEQLAWADAEIGVIIHLDINIYSPTTFDYKDRGTLPDVNVFNPSKLNTDQWIRTAKAAGAKYALLTVKHGTGFCLWPSKVNTYNVGHTRWKNAKGDILKDFVASCKKYGIKPGLYYNTNSNTYYNAGYKPFISDSAHKAYNKAVLAQLKEIWSGYGKMFEIWFDGGITADKGNGIEGDVLKMIHTLQPQAILFQGPVKEKNIIRWIGNEDGIAAYPQWSRAHATTASNGLQKIEDLHGSLDGKFWCPGESDFPARRNNAWNGGWLWRANEESYLFSVRELTEKYYKSVGRNTNMLVGMVVDTSGLIPKQDSLVFDSLGRNIRHLFSAPVVSIRNSAEKIIVLNIPARKLVNQVMIRENLALGENIRSYTLEALVNGIWKKIAKGQSIGHKRIQTFQAVSANKLRLTVTGAVGNFSVKELTCYQNGLNIDTD